MRKRNKRKPNRKIRDSVFVDLFCKDRDAKKNFLELYNSLNGKNLKLEDTKIECVNLEQVLYMTYYNDVSMLVDGKVVVLCEHQSTVNENMPLRFLIYVARIYEKLISKEDKFAWNRIPLATPEFFVFYNGEEELPAITELKLSDSYMVDVSNKFENQLELKVKVYNLNKLSEIPEIEMCKVMSDYSKFIQLVVKERANGGDYIKRAISSALKHDILADYLNRKSSEVFNMLLNEYNYKTDMQTRYKEGFSYGIKQGMQQGMQRGMLKNLIDLVNDKIISSEIAAKKANMSQSDFLKLLNDKDF